MTEIGTVVRGDPIGRRGVGRYYIFSVCKTCGLQHWVEKANGGIRRSVCNSLHLKRLRCPHCWTIAGQNGETSPARCKLCGKVDMFRNSFGADERMPFAVPPARENVPVWWGKMEKVR